MAFERIYLPMQNREAGYCVTNIEQVHLARRFATDVQTVRAAIFELLSEMQPQKSASKTKKLIGEKLKAVMQSGVRAR